MAEFDGVVRVDEIVIRKTQREEKERALLLGTDMFVREGEREKEREFGEVVEEGEVMSSVYVSER